MEQNKVIEQPLPSPVFFLSLSSPVSQRGMGGWRNFKCQKGEEQKFVSQNWVMSFFVVKSYKKKKLGCDSLDLEGVVWVMI